LAAFLTGWFVKITAIISEAVRIHIAVPNDFLQHPYRGLNYRSEANAN
jgi:hypothetical protein